MVRPRFSPIPGTVCRSAYSRAASCLVCRWSCFSTSKIWWSKWRIISRSFLNASWRRGWISALRSCSSQGSRVQRLCLAVVGQLMAVDAGQQLGAAPDVEDALAQQRAQRPLLSRVHVGGGNEIGAQEVREFFGVDPVVLVFAAVNGSDVEGVGQDKAQAGGLAGIGQPVPPEHALTADGETVLVGLDELEEVLEVVVLDVGVDQLFALPIHDADVHLARMQIDSAVELGRGGVILHN